MKEFGKELIKFRRLELGLSEKELSSLTGIKEDTLCKLELGTIPRVSLAKTINICLVLGIDLFSLLEVDEDLLVIPKYFFDVFNKRNIMAKVYE